MNEEFETTNTNPQTESEEATKKTPEEMIDENRPQFIGDLIECESNTKMDVVATTSLGKMIFNACTNIFMSHSDHKKMYPSFDDFEYAEVDILKDDPHINIRAFEKDFTVSITKMPDAYTELAESEDVKDHIVFNTRIEDNMVVSEMAVSTTGDTVCEIIPLVIPYAFIDSSYGVMAPANEENYKDLHDTILGFSTMLNIACVDETHCHEGDVFCYEDGFDIAYKKALRQKIAFDMENHKTAIEYYKSMITKYESLMNSSKRTIRRCNRSLKKIQSIIRGL